ncbi:altered inheritance of mitochondria protein 3 [Aedes aegypti]|uniref:Uncharacterized protein n=1 Tax=Aedes aegypti TaxID=7159 RepID=A0A1S4EUR9_AEDAE|nr:altered inheritance of mitochondria protein 3 [Aedes aegypti]
MKTILCIIGLMVVVCDLAQAEPEPVAPDTRKARHPSSGPTSYNSIPGPDSETLSKLQNQVAPSVQIPLKPIGSPGKTSEAPQAYTVTSNQPTNPHPSTFTAQNIAGQYYVAMTPQATGNQVLSPATTPLIMQYINPQGQPTGGLQYIQLLRPMVYPYGTQYVQPSYVQQQQPQQPSNTHGQHQPQHLHQLHSHLSHYSSPIQQLSQVSSSPTSPTTTQSSFVPFQPSSLQQYATAATAATHHHLASPAAFPSQVAQYSSPVLSYYPSRISLINGPGSMALNTNEYMPSPGDQVYIKGVKSIRA